MIKSPNKFEDRGTLVDRCGKQKFIFEKNLREKQYVHEDMGTDELNEKHDRYAKLEKGNGQQEKDMNSMELHELNQRYLSNDPDDLTAEVINSFVGHKYRKRSNMF